MSSWLGYLLFGIMIAYLAAGVPILRRVERSRWDTNRLKLWEASVAWLLANAGAGVFVVGTHWFFPYLHIGSNYDLPDVLLFGAGLILSLSILTRFWFHRRLGRRDAFKAIAVVATYYFIVAMAVFALYEDAQRRERFQGAVSAKSTVELRQRTLLELAQGLGLSFPADARLIWAHSKGRFDAPWVATAVVELGRENLLAFMEQIGTKGCRKLLNCPACLADDEQLYARFGPGWGPRKWWHPQSAQHFEVWTGDHFDVLVDLDDAQTARLYMIYAAI